MADPEHDLEAQRTQRWDRVPDLGGPAVRGRPPVPSRAPAPVPAPQADAEVEADTARHEPAEPDHDDVDHDDAEWGDVDWDDAEWDGDHEDRARDPLWRVLVRSAGELLVTAGVVVLLFVVYEVYVTDLLNDHTQSTLSDEIHEQWDAVAAAPEDLVAPAVGEPLAVLHVPRLGADWSRVVLEGTAEDELAQGPGHYVGTALPGQPGNLAIAGHRVGKGSPFLDADQLVPGDAIVVETAQNWYVYRVLGDAATGDYATDPSGIPGQQVVRPADVAVISPTPGAAAAAAPTGAYLTLTTCHPKYSARQRLIVHAVLDGSPVSKAGSPDGPPALTGD
jgi:sortase A